MSYDFNQDYIIDCHVLIYNLVAMPPKTDNKELLRSKINIDTSATITDFQYSHNGNKLAVSDSDGFIFIYERQIQGFTKTASFRADEAAVWRLAWADPTLGDTIAIGSFNRKVAVFQLKAGHWTEIAYHQLHQGSVNQIQWAPIAFGCKLFSAGSDGAVAILETKKNGWVSSHFYAHQYTISALSVRPIALNQIQDRQGSYPMIATAAKDNLVKIWRHTSEIPEEELQNEARIYQQIATFKPHKQAIRALLWKQKWCQTFPLTYELFSCSEDGSVKQSSFVSDKLTQTSSVCQYQLPIFRISQSLTGNMLTVSVGKDEVSYLYGKRSSESGWEMLQQLK